MLLYKNEEDRIIMNKYYRTSDMIKLLKYFPDLSPIIDLTIIENEKDYYENEEYINTLHNNRVDTLKTKVMALNTDNKGIRREFYRFINVYKI